uniref:Putative rna-directed dna polymerase from mobile element jockey-like isoform x3 n=1 Tax=Xenopsylla cheopis TaxID=163159 RepID=A0A6M2DJW2_XENCH
MEHLNIVQLNCRSLSANKDSLEFFLGENKISVAALSETWTKADSKFYFKGYNLFRTDREDGFGGSAILVSKTLNCREVEVINIDPFVQICAVKLCLAIPLLIVSVYCAPNKVIDLSPLKKLNFKDFKVLICGDFNSHHVAWGCEYVCSRGKLLYELMEDLSLIILNDGSHTTIGSWSRKPSSIDLTMCSSYLAGISHWSVSSEPIGSDHLPILISLDVNVQTKIVVFPNKKWNTKSANWESYSSVIQNFYNSNPIPNDLHEKYTFFSKALDDASFKCLKQNKKKMISSFRNSVWWDDDCTKAVKDRKRLYNILRQDFNFENYINFKKTNAKTKLFLKKRKRDKWMEYTRSINSNTDPQNVWSQIRKFSNKNSFNRVNRFLTVDFSESLLKFYAPDHVNNVIIQNNFQQDQNLNFKPFTVEELDNALKSRRNSAPGLDHIEYIMLKNNPTQAKNLLVDIFNNCIMEHWIPEEWKSIIIIPILKINKDPWLTNSYRPISLMSCVAKTFERMIKNRLEWVIENGSILNRYQFGFRRGRGTMDVLAMLSNDIYISNSLNKYLLLLTMDIEKAYDNIDHNILELKLIRAKVPLSLTKVIMKLVSMRHLYIRSSSGVVGPRYVHQGIAQGSILSPLLFNIYTMDLIKDSESNVKTIQYADDIYLYTSRSSLDDCISDLSTDVQEKSFWFQINKMNLSHSKNLAIVFTRHRAPIHPSHLIFGHFKFLIQKEIKILGVHFDTKMTFKKHIVETSKRCEKGINILRKLSGTNWGAHPSACLNIYKSIIRSQIDYGSFIYGYCKNRLLYNLDKIQFTAIRSCIGAIRSTPTNVLIREAGESPLHIRRQILAQRFLIKKFSTEYEGIPTQLIELARLHFTKKFWLKQSTPPLISSFYNLYPCKDQIIINSKLPYYSYSYPFTNLSNFILPSSKLVNVQSDNICIINREFEQAINSRWPNYIHIYTDGSKIDGKVGCAFFVHQLNLKKMIKLSKYASIFTAELIAIYEALTFVKRKNIKNTIIFTDSNAALIALRKPKVTANKIVFMIIDFIQDLIKNRHSVFLCWIKGHEGIYGNTVADLLAKEAANSGDESLYLIPASDLKFMVKNKGIKQWQYEYSVSIQVKGKLYSKIEPRVSQVPWFNNSPDNRKFITTMCRIRFGHTFLKSHLHRIGIAPDEDCKCGASKETLDHVLWECQLYMSSRDCLFKELQKYNLIFPVNAFLLIKSGNICIYKIIIYFLHSNNINI